MGNFDSWLSDEDSVIQADSYYEEKAKEDDIKADRAEEF